MKKKYNNNKTVDKSDPVVVDSINRVDGNTTSPVTSSDVSVASSDSSSASVTSDGVVTTSHPAATSAGSASADMVLEIGGRTWLVEDKNNEKILNRYKHDGIILYNPNSNSAVPEKLVIVATDIRNSNLQCVIKFSKWPDNYAEDLANLPEIRIISSLRVKEEFQKFIPDSYGNGKCDIAVSHNNKVGQYNKYYFIAMQNLPYTDISQRYKDFFGKNVLKWLKKIFNITEDVLKNYIIQYFSNNAAKNAPCPLGKYPNSGINKYIKNKINNDFDNLLSSHTYGNDSRDIYIIKRQCGESFINLDMAVTSSKERVLSLDYQYILNVLIEKGNDKDKPALLKIRKQASKAALKNLLPDLKNILKFLHKLHTEEEMTHGDIKHNNLMSSTGSNNTTIYLIDWASVREKIHMGGGTASRSSNHLGDDYPNISELTPDNKDILYFSNMLADIIAVPSDSGMMSLRLNRASEKKEDVNKLKRELKNIGAPFYVANAIQGVTLRRINSAKGYLNALNALNLKRTAIILFIVLFVILSCIAISIFGGIKTGENEQQEMPADQSITSILNSQWEDEQLRSWLYAGYSDVELSKSLIDRIYVAEIHVPTRKTFALESYNTNQPDVMPDLSEYYFYDEYDGSYSCPVRTDDNIVVFETLSKDKITSFDDIKNYLPNVKTLIIANCTIPEYSDALNDMEVLESVVLYNCDVTSLQPFLNVKNLWIKNCGDEMTSLSGIDMLTKAKYLSLHGFDLDLTGIGSLDKLEKLDIRGSDYDSSLLIELDVERTKLISQQDVELKKQQAERIAMLDAVGVVEDSILRESWTDLQLWEWQFNNEAIGNLNFNDSERKLSMAINAPNLEDLYVVEYDIDYSENNGVIDYVYSSWGQYTFYLNNNGTEAAELYKERKKEKITSFDDIEKFYPNLQMLVIANCEIPEYSDALNNMADLEKVVLYNCDVTCLQPFQNVKHLYIINQSNEDIKLSGFNYLKKAKDIYLRGCNLDLSGISSLEQLSTLDIRDNTYDDTLAEIANSQIAYLYLDGVTDADIYWLDQCELEYLNISYSDFSSNFDKLLNFISYNIDSLEFTSCKLSFAKLTEFGDKCDAFDISVYADNCYDINTGRYLDYRNQTNEQHYIELNPDAEKGIVF